jgi:hypothetical protein
MRLNYNLQQSQAQKPEKKENPKTALNKQIMLNNLLAGSQPQAGAQGAVMTPTSNGYGRTV